MTRYWKAMDCAPQKTESSFTTFSSLIVSEGETNSCLLNSFIHIRDPNFTLSIDKSFRVHYLPKMSSICDLDRASYNLPLHYLRAPLPLIYPESNMDSIPNIHWILIHNGAFYWFKGRDSWNTSGWGKRTKILLGHTRKKRQDPR